MHLHRSQWIDLLGGGLSALCVVHCLSLPVLAVVLPFILGTFDVWLGISLVSVASLALIAGHLSHRRWTPVFPFLAGLSLVLVSRLVVREHSVESIILSVIGGVLLVVAHVLNFKANRAAACCPATA